MRFRTVAMHSKTALYMDFQLFPAAFLWLKRPKKKKQSTLKMFCNEVRARCSTKLHCLFSSSEMTIWKQNFLSQGSHCPEMECVHHNFLNPLPMDGSYTIQLYMYVLQIFTSKHIPLTYLTFEWKRWAFLRCNSSGLNRYLTARTAHLKCLPCTYLLKESRQTPLV